LNRTIEKTVNGPAYAYLTAGWALRTAAVFEGVIDRLGETLCPTWNDPPDKPNKSPAWQPLAERHRFVRRLVSLDNGTKGYADISGLVHQLVWFRDSFAHPKVLEQTIQEIVQHDLAPDPQIAAAQKGGRGEEEGRREFGRRSRCCHRRKHRYLDGGELSVSCAESVGYVVRPERLELPTCWFEAGERREISELQR